MGTPTSPMMLAYLLCSVALLLSAANARAVTIPTVPVGNAGNAADMEVMVDDGTTGYGSVAYNYRIGTTEVTNAQYAEFLNAKAASDPLELYNTNMGIDFGGIMRDGPEGSYTYATISGRENMPVNWVSWYDSIRVANWLHNAQGSGDTETGAYTLGDLDGNGIPLNGVTIARNAGATWFLTSEDEWYKAAFHKNDGATSNYFDFPTSSDSEPTDEPPPGGSNSANYVFGGDLTDVGAYTESASPYGTFDQGGNVWEWNEALMIDGSSRGLRAGSFYSFSYEMMSNYRALNFIPPTYEVFDVGFRVATVPEPTAFALAAVAFVGLFALQRCRRAACAGLLVTTLALLAPAAQGAPFTNGSFEMPGGLPPSSGLLLPPGDTTLVGWSVGGSGGPVVYSNNGYYGDGLNTIDGTYELAFNGGDDAPGTFISQSFDTVVGQQYDVTFFVGRLGEDFQNVSLTASALSVGDSILASLQAFPPDPLPRYYGYGPVQTLFFTATTATTTLRFMDTSLDTYRVDVLLDNVAVVAVPEPTAFALAAIGILALMVLCSRRRFTGSAVVLLTFASLTADTRQLSAGLVSQNLPLSAYSASAFYPDPSAVPHLAFDGNLLTAWNAGGYAMQWLEVDLQQPYDVTSLSLYVNQFPDGNTIHELWASSSAIQNDLSGATLIHTFSGFTSGAGGGSGHGQILSYTLPASVSAEFIQLRTTESPSWISWDEFQVFAVPEPSTLALAAGGILVLAGLRKRRSLAAVTLAACVFASTPQLAWGDPSRYEPTADPSIGFNLISWQNFGSAGPAVWAGSVQTLYDAGFRQVSINPVRYFDPNNGVIDASHHQGPELSHIAAGIDRAKSLGMTVTVTPFVEFQDFTQWRAFWNPTPGSETSDQFWSDYRQYLVDVAQVASTYGADAMNVGTELRGLVQNPGNNAHWDATIDAVAADFEGQLGYAANWDDYRDGNLTSALWNHPAINYVGIDAYFPMATSQEADTSGADPNPDFISLLTGNWNSLLENDILPFAGSLKDGAGMPVVISEYGLLPYNGSVVQHSGVQIGNVDRDEQIMGFKALNAAMDHRMADDDVLSINVWQWGMPGSNGSLWNMDTTLPADQPLNVPATQYLADFVTHPVVPEPSSVALAAVGLFGLTAWRRSLTLICALAVSRTSESYKAHTP